MTLIYAWTLVFQLHTGWENSRTAQMITVVPDFATQSECQAAAAEIQLQRGKDVWWICFKVRK